MNNRTIRLGFTFKQFHVAHESCAMKVGTDAILLGAWAPLNATSRVLDIGTGSGILSLMLAQRASKSLHIDAIDIDPSAVAQAQENVNNSPWSECIQCHQSRLQDHEAVAYDLLISNPPYFPHGQTLSTPARQRARHTEYLPHDQLLLHAARLAHPHSALALILPTSVATTIIQTAKKTGWHLHTHCSIIPILGKPANRELLLFQRIEEQNDRHTELTIRQANRTYTPSFTQLCRDFYLKM